MYDVHLWIILRESTLESDQGSLGNKLQALREVVAETLPDAVPRSPIHALNFEYILQCSVSHNHRGDAHDRLLSVLAVITRTLPGSYGLAYWFDDEQQDTDGHSAKYNVLVVARGLVDSRMDPFLSPLVSVVED
jgi:hypothetical protein